MSVTVGIWIFLVNGIGIDVSGQGARQRRSGIPSQLDVLVELRRSNPKDYLEKIQR